MGLYNFQPRFVPKILSGEKTHTIRADRKFPDEPGDTMHLYTGLRTKNAYLLMRRPCVRVEPIEIRMELYRGSGVLVAGLKFPKIFIDGVELDRSETQAFARRDGFESFADMIGFWDGRLPFRGQLYHWSFVA